MSLRAVYSPAGRFSLKDVLSFKLKHSITFPAAGRVGAGDSQVVAGSEDGGRKERAARPRRRAASGLFRSEDCSRGLYAYPHPHRPCRWPMKGDQVQDNRVPPLISFAGMETCFFLVVQGSGTARPETKYAGSWQEGRPRHGSLEVISIYSPLRPLSL